MTKVQFDYKRCTSCMKCVKICPVNVLKERNGRPAVIDEAACTVCGICADQCPKKAITVQVPKDHQRYEAGEAPDPKNVELAGALMDALGMEKSPVAVKLINENEEFPACAKEYVHPIRHCVSVHMASLGAVFYLTREKHACSAAKAALGIEPLPVKVSDGTVPYMHGLASSKEVAARIMSEIPKLPAGSVKGTLLAPLEKAFFEPDVVILTVTPKQAMWVANSLLFAKGGPRISANFAGMQAACADSTTLPVQSGKVNFSLGCYGCRSAGKLADGEMYAGIPIGKLEAVVEGLKGLRRAMGKLKEAGHREEKSKKGCGT